MAGSLSDGKRVALISWIFGATFFGWFICLIKWPIQTIFSSLLMFWFIEYSQWGNHLFGTTGHDIYWAGLFTWKWIVFIFALSFWSICINKWPITTIAISIVCFLIGASYYTQ